MGQGKNIESGDTCINIRLIIWIINASKQNKKDEDYITYKIVSIQEKSINMCVMLSGHVTSDSIRLIV